MSGFEEHLKSCV